MFVDNSSAASVGLWYVGGIKVVGCSTGSCGYIGWGGGCCCMYGDGLLWWFFGT